MENNQNRLKKGDIVTLDSGFNNSSQVKVIRTGKIFATVSTLDGLVKWDTMINRLSKIK